MKRSLATLARLRRMEADQAKRALGEAVGHEVAAEHAAAQARTQRLREAEESRAQEGDALAGAYAAWLPASAQKIAVADAEMAARQTQRAEAAQYVRACRAALEAVETLIEKQEQLKRRQAVRHAQHRLDELARRPDLAARGDPPNGAAASRRWH